MSWIKLTYHQKMVVRMGFSGWASMIKIGEGPRSESLRVRYEAGPQGLALVAHDATGKVPMPLEAFLLAKIFLNKQNELIDRELASENIDEMPDYAQVRRDLKLEIIRNNKMIDAANELMEMIGG